jgi:hypothetical protein
MLTASGDPAAACCSTIPQLQNPEVNPCLLSNALWVAGEDDSGETHSSSSNFELSGSSSEETPEDSEEVPIPEISSLARPSETSASVPFPKTAKPLPGTPDLKSKSTDGIDFRNYCSSHGELFGFDKDKQTSSVGEVKKILSPRVLRNLGDKPEPPKKTSKHGKDKGKEPEQKSSRTPRDEGRSKSPRADSKTSRDSGKAKHGSQEKPDVPKKIAKGDPNSSSAPGLKNPKKSQLPPKPVRGSDTTLETVLAGKESKK